MAETALIPTTDEMNTYQVMAKHAANSGFFKNIGGEGGLLSIVLYARELGLPPMQCLFGGMHNIKGNIELSPRLMNAMIRKCGHKLEILECNNVICRISGTRSDTGEKYEASFCIDDAKSAGIYRSESSWTRHPSDMLFKSCLSRVARRLFPDVISTAYVEDEIPDDNDKEIKVKDPVDAVRIIDVKSVEVETAPEPTLTKDQARIIEKLIGEDGDLFNRILDGYKVANLLDIPDKHFDIICGTLKKRKEIKQK